MAKVDWEGHLWWAKRLNSQAQFLSNICESGSILDHMEPEHMDVTMEAFKGISEDMLKCCENLIEHLERDRAEGRQPDPDPTQDQGDPAVQERLDEIFEDQPEA